MAPNKVLVLCVFLCLLSSLLLLCASSEPESQFQRKFSIGRRKMLDLVDDDDDEVKPLPKIKKPTTTATNTLSTKNQTKPLKPKSNLSTKNQTKPITPSKSSSTNSTKSQKIPSSSSSSSSPQLPKAKTELKKLNSTKKLSPSSSSSSSLLKSATPKNKTTKPNSNLNSDQKTQKATQSSKPTKPNSSLNSDQKTQKTTQSNKPTKPITKPSSIWLEEFEEDDLVSEFRDLPTKFHQTLIPDLEKISTTSKIYIDLANKQMTRNFKPIVGKKYASTIASITSFTFITIPLLLVSLIFNKIKSYFTLQKLLIFIQIYLSIYFSILCLSSLVTGLEPLRFFYATSLSTYVCVQILQTLCYVFYILILIVYLVVVFSTDCGMGPRFLGLAQMFVGLAVGLHYYVSVFHRVVLRQPPRTNWKVHGIYATCFLVICLLAQAERRKKAYLEEGGEEGKKS